MDINTDAMAGMSSAEAEAYVKAQLTAETNAEPVIEEPKAEPEAPKTEEAAMPKDKAVQKEKILKSQIRSRKEKAEKAEQEKQELLKKIASGEVDNDLDAQEKLLEKLIEAKLAKANVVSSEENEKVEFLRNHPNESDLFTHIEDIVKENPTLSREQARILYLAENKPEQIYDPIEENRAKLSRQATSGMSVSSEERPMEQMKSDDIAALGKEMLKSGKIFNNF